MKYLRCRPSQSIRRGSLDHLCRGPFKCNRSAKAVALRKKLYIETEGADPNVQ